MRLTAFISIIHQGAKELCNGGCVRRFGLLKRFLEIRTCIVRVAIGGHGAIQKSCLCKRFAFFIFIQNIVHYLFGMSYYFIQKLIVVHLLRFGSDIKNGGVCDLRIFGVAIQLFLELSDHIVIVGFGHPLGQIASVFG